MAVHEKSPDFSDNIRIFAPKPNIVSDFFKQLYSGKDLDPVNILTVFQTRK